MTRGAFEVSIIWEDYSAKIISILSKKGGELKLNYQNISSAYLKNTGISVQVLDRDKICIQTKPMETYEFLLESSFVRVEPPVHLKIQDTTLNWSGDKTTSYCIYRAVDSEPVFTKIASEINAFCYTDSFDFASCETVTYMVTASMNGYESKGISCTLNHATHLQKDIYRNQLKGKNQYL